MSVLRLVWPLGLTRSEREGRRKEEFSEARSRRYRDSPRQPRYGRSARMKPQQPNEHHCREGQHNRGITEVGYCIHLARSSWRYTGSMRYELDYYMVIAVTRWLEGDCSVKDEGSALPTAEVRQFQTDALPAPVHLPSVIGSADG
jgi:hypothetical protein